MIKKVISDSEKLVHWMDQKLNGFEISGDLRPRISCACFDLAMEHQKSIILLISNHLTGSAFSLVRLLFESYIRGMWLYEKASDKELEKFQKKDILDKNFDTLVQEVEKIQGYEGGILKKAKDAGWRPMNSYTHCGFMQISRRNTPDSIEANYSDEEVLEAINFANAVGLLSLLGVARIPNEIKFQNEILAKIKELYPNNSIQHD